MAAAARNAADRALLACAATICATTEVGRAVREWAEVRVFLSGWAMATLVQHNLTRCRFEIFRPIFFRRIS